MGGSSSSAVISEEDEQSAAPTVGETTSLVGETDGAEASGERDKREAISALDVVAAEVTAGDDDQDADDGTPVRLRYKGKLYILTNASDSLAMMQDPAYIRATRRMGAIIVTFLIELIVAFQISQYQDTLKTYPLLMSFLPVISAVSGNVGLQSGSLTARGLEVGTVKLENRGWLKQLSREMVAGLIMATVSAVIFFGVSGSWANSRRFGVVIALCVWCSTIIAAFSGTLAPILFKMLGTDPIAWAGPLETGLQDVLGNTAFLYIASVILTTWDFR